MGIKKVEAYICVCDNCGREYEEGDIMPAACSESEMEDIVCSDLDWIKEHGNYYCPECAQSDNYKVGDIVPYKNTRGNLELAKITSFETVDNGNVWFNGVDMVTNAHVWYPVHDSKKLRS